MPSKCFRSNTHMIMNQQERVEVLKNSPSTDLRLRCNADHNPSSPGSPYPFTGVGADTAAGSQRPIQSLAYEISSSAVIPYTSSAYSHIQNPVFTSWQGKLGTDKVGVFLLVFQRVFLSMDVGNRPSRQQNVSRSNS